MRSKIKFILMVLFTHQIALAAVYEFVAKNGELKALAKGKPSLLDINVEGEGPYGSLVADKQNKLSGELSLNLDLLKTGIPKRDEHLKEKYLDTKKFQTAKLVLKDITYAGQDVSSAKFNGLLEIKGVSKPVSGDYSVKKEGDQLKVETSFAFNLSSFGIEMPRFSGIVVGDEIKLKTISKVLVK